MLKPEAYRLTVRLFVASTAEDSVSELGALMPKTAQVRRGDQIVETKVDDLQVEDVVVVRPGDRVPVDGAVISGESTIDQAPITGESVPVQKAPGRLFEWHQQCSADSQSVASHRRNGASARLRANQLAHRVNGTIPHHRA